MNRNQGRSVSLLTLQVIVGVVLLVTAFACSTSSSDLKLTEVSSGQGVLFGHIDFYNGEEKIDESGMTSRCWVTFSDDKGDRQARVSMDPTGWVFASAAVGTISISRINCNAGFLHSHPELETNALHFTIPSERSAVYFGNLTVRFGYHGLSLGVIGGAVGAAIQASSEGTTIDGVGVQVENQFEPASQEFRSRFNADGSAFKLVDATMVVQTAPKNSQQ